MSDDRFAELLIHCSTAKYWAYSANATKAAMKKALAEEQLYKKKVQEDTRVWNAKRGRIAKIKLANQRHTIRKSSTIVGTMIGLMNKI